jgi:very-short-patch-repair endonuclease
MITNQQKAAINRLKLLKRTTKHEKRLSDILGNCGYRLMPQKGFIRDNKCFIVDFYLPEYKCVIEVDGGYHFDKENESYDKYREDYLRFDRNFAIIRISNDYMDTKTNQELRITFNYALNQIKRQDKYVLY